MTSTLRTFARVGLGWEPEEKLSDTAWLNGVRGLAAFLVLMSHYTNAFMSSLSEAPFGALVTQDTAFNEVWYFREGQRLWSLWRLPIIRITMCDGGGQVALFFVISGFVLTWSPLKLAQSGDHDKLLRSLASSTFRRWSRLYLPCIIVTYLYVLHNVFTHYEGFLAFLQSTWHYLVDAQVWANPFRTVAEELFSGMQGLNLAVWTIPYEFSGSVFVYVLAMIVGRIQNYPRRTAIIVFVTLYSMFTLKWGLWLFGAGMVMADYARNAELLGKEPKMLSLWMCMVWAWCLLVGLVLLSYPLWGEAYTRPPYDLLEYIPLPPGWRQHSGEDRFWWGLGAILILTSVCHVRILRVFFELPLLQHLGKISFMLYLIHLLIADAVGKPLQSSIYAAACTYEDDKSMGKICRLNPMLHGLILFTVFASTVLPVMVIAHILERFVDRPVTALGKVVDDLAVNGFSREVEEIKAPEQEHLLEDAVVEQMEMNGLRVGP